MQTNGLNPSMVAERGTPGQYIGIGGWSKDVQIGSKAMLLSLALLYSVLTFNFVCQIL